MSCDCVHIPLYQPRKKQKLNKREKNQIKKNE